MNLMLCWLMKRGPYVLVLLSIISSGINGCTRSNRNKLVLLIGIRQGWLHKSLYGLKQAPRAWFTRFSQTLLELGFVSSTVDSSLFVFHQDSIHLYILIYVDDILFTETSTSHIASVIAKLQQVFKLKDLGNLSYFLGIQAVRSSQGLHLRQAKYISNLLSRSKMMGAKPFSSPCLAGSKMSTKDGDPLSPEDTTLYRQTVGALQYCTLTRPDIAFFVNQLCQHMHTPPTLHWTTAKRVLCYLKGTTLKGLLTMAYGTPKVHCIFRPFVTLTGQVIRMIVVLQLVLVLFWDPLSSLGLLRNNSWSHVQLQRLNIVPWPLQLLISFGCACYLRILVFLCFRLLAYGVITLGLLLLLLTPFIMLGLNILKSTTILFVRRC
jgi:hypothetical protein